LVDQVVVVFGDLVHEEFLGADDGGKESKLNGRGIIEGGGAGDSGDNRREGGMLTSASLRMGMEVRIFWSWVAAS
jgi:hypothetical protein